MIDLIKTLLIEWKERKIPIILDRTIDLRKYLKLKISKIIEKSWENLPDVGQLNLLYCSLIN